jgi:hypothetical protein
MTLTGHAVSVTMLLFEVQLLLLCAVLQPFGLLALSFVGIPALIRLLVALLSFSPSIG